MIVGRYTLGQTRTQETRDLLDQSVGSNKGIVLASKLLDELLVLVQLFQIIRAHSINTTVLSTIDIMLITEDTILDQPKSFRSLIMSFPDIPNAHARAGDDRETDCSGETLVTLRIVVLEADLEFDGFEEVALLRLEGVFEEFLDVGTHSGCGESYQGVALCTIV